MTLTEEHIKIIADCPLNDSLARFLEKLGRLDAANDAWRTDIATVLSVLVASPVAFNLALPDGSTNVAVKLLSILQHVQGGLLMLDHFRRLIDAVVANSPDTDVWDVVINLIDAVNPSTPPPTSIIPTGRGTPVKTSSSQARVSSSSARSTFLESASIFVSRHSFTSCAIGENSMSFFFSVFG